MFVLFLRVAHRDISFSVYDLPVMPKNPSHHVILHYTLFSQVLSQYIKLHEQKLSFELIISVKLDYSFSKYEST